MPRAAEILNKIHRSLQRPERKAHAMDHPVFSAIMTSAAIEKFRSRNPERMGTVGEYTFYECPIHGDETTLLATDDNGTWGKTHHWEVPDLHEIYDTPVAAA